MQYVKNKPLRLMRFQNPLELSNHKGMEGTTLMEGKYWKRKKDEIQKEYFNWRKRFHEKFGDHSFHFDLNSIDWSSIDFSSQNQVEGSQDDLDLSSILVNEEKLVDFILNLTQEASTSGSELANFLACSSVESGYGNSSNTTTMAAMAVPFPNPRDYYHTTTNADLLQPGLTSLQPNIEEINYSWNTYNNSNIPSTNNSFNGSSGNPEKDLLSVVVTATTSSANTNIMHVLPQPSNYDPVDRNEPITHHQLMTPQQQQQQQPQQQQQQILISNQQHIPNQQLIPPTKNAQNYILPDQSPISPPFIMPQSTYTSPIVMNSTSNSNDRYLGQHSAGNKQRVHVGSAQPNVPYPSPSPGKAISPKQRLLQLRNPTNYSSYAKPSELVQLLKPKIEATNVNVPSNEKSKIKPTVYPRIPPPLPTDYPQESEVQNSRPRGNANPEHRRNIHINSEQNRRTSIKHGFDELRALIPSLRNVSTSSHKISKAALLHKGGDYLKEMKKQIHKIENEAAQLKMTIEKCEMDVSALQGFLPNSGTSNHRRSNTNNSGPQQPVSICGKLRQKKSEEDVIKLGQMFNENVREGTEMNWKYWAFTRLMKPLFDTYIEAVSNCASMDEVERSAKHWVEHKCELTQTRQYTMNALKKISVQTNILEEPHLMVSNVKYLAEEGPFDDTNGH